MVINFYTDFRLHTEQTFGLYCFYRRGNTLPETVFCPVQVSAKVRLYIYVHSFFKYYLALGKSGNRGNLRLFFAIIAIIAIILNKFLIFSNFNFFK